MAAAGVPRCGDSAISGWKSRWHVWQVEVSARERSQSIQSDLRSAHAPLHRKPVKHFKTSRAFTQLPADAISGTEVMPAEAFRTSVNHEPSLLVPTSWGKCIHRSGDAWKLSVNWPILKMNGEMLYLSISWDLGRGVSLYVSAQTYFFGQGNPLRLGMIIQQARFFPKV